MKTLWKLFFTFAKIGAFTFGGGYAMLSILQREIVEINNDDNTILAHMFISKTFRILKDKTNAITL